MRALAEAIGQHPADVDAIAVYADALEQVGDPLGEYLHVACRLHDLDEAAPDRHPLALRMAELFDAHGERWLAAWNDPEVRFLPHHLRFCGLPNTLALHDTLPTDLAALARQVAGLPIQALELQNIGLPELAALDELALCQRVTTLQVSGSYDRRLGPDVGAWLAKRSFAAVRTLSLWDVELGATAAAVLDSMPALRCLTTFAGGLTAADRQR